MAKQNLELDDLISEMKDIKKLLIFILIKSGASQVEVATALNVNQSSISRLFPKNSKRSK